MIAGPSLAVRGAGVALHTRCIEPSPYTRHDATSRVGLPARLAWLPARCLRPCFVDREGAAGQGQAVEGVNGALHRLAVWHLDEARTPRTASLAVGHHPDCAVPQMSNNWPLPRHNNVSSSPRMTISWRSRHASRTSVFSIGTRNDTLLEK